MRDRSSTTVYHRLKRLDTRSFLPQPSEFLDYAKAMKANNTPGGMALGHATADASGWVYWCLWAHGGNIVDKNDKVILNSPETEKALVFAKQLFEQMIPGVLAWNDASNNKAFLANEIHWTNNTISIYAAATRDPTKKEIAEDMDHADWPVGPIGHSTEFHIVDPLLAMAYTKYPQACKALMAFIMDADQYNKWLYACQGYISPPLKAYVANPVWIGRSKAHRFPRFCRSIAHDWWFGLGRREGRKRVLRFCARRYVRELLHRPRGRQGRDAERGATAAADLSVS